jgi:3'-phosphoadenosine 5'-phosphosulfate sulfotransferase (PAPS reductase)/FAD synthetase
VGKKKEKHILSLSGGKDSAALAVYMRENYPNIPLEYVFIDSGCELPETYEYLQRIEAVLNIRIVKIGGANKNDRRDFSWWLKEKNYYLPSPSNRWCTEVLKLMPYKKWLYSEYQGYKVHSYVGLRSDEAKDRKGYIDTSGINSQHYPFIEDGLIYDDIVNLLEDSGLGFPGYYGWRRRSGCFFCFFQTKTEWIGLYDNHNDLFLQSAAMEKTGLEPGYTWCEGVTLMELLGMRDIIEKNKLTDDRIKKDRYSLMEILNCCCSNNKVSNYRLFSDRGCE